MRILFNSTSGWSMVLKYSQVLACLSVKNGYCFLMDRVDTSLKIKSGWLLGCIKGIIPTA